MPLTPGVFCISSAENVQKEAAQGQVRLQIYASAKGEV